MRCVGMRTESLRPAIFSLATSVLRRLTTIRIVHLKARPTASAEVGLSPFLLLDGALKRRVGPESCAHGTYLDKIPMIVKAKLDGAT